MKKVALAFVVVLLLALTIAVAVIASIQYQAHSHSERLHELMREKSTAVSDALTQYLDSAEHTEYIRALKADTKSIAAGNGTDPAEIEVYHRAKEGDLKRENEVSKVEQEWDERIRNYEMGMGN